MKYYFTLLFLFIVILFSNCSLQKRHYRHGYNISINKDLNKRNLTNSSLNKQFNDAISFNNDKITSINFTNGISEVINSPKINSTNNCYDIIKIRTKSLNGYISEINSQVILYDRLLSNGKLKKSSIRKNAVTKIEFCGGTTITNEDLKKVNTVINKKEEMTDTTFWKNYHYDIIYIKSESNAGTEEIIGLISQIGPDSIKYIPYNDSQNIESTISSNNIKNIKINNIEVISNYELKQLGKKIDSNIEIQKYVKSMDRKESLVKKLADRAFLYGIIAFLLPIIGIPFGIKAIKSSSNARKIIATTPELKKYKAKMMLGNLLGIFCIIFSGIILIFGLFYALGLALGLA